jgi:hypothetical protein
MKATGVFATPEECKAMLARLSQPRIATNLIYEDAAQMCHRLALSHGLPETAVRYGCDLETGEFLTA